MYRLQTFTAVFLVAVLFGAVAVSAEEVTLTIALRSGASTVAVYREILDEFEALNPGIKIAIENMSSTVFNERILLQIAGGIPPDLLYIHYTFFPELASQGFLLPLDDRIGTEGYGIDDFFPPTLEQLTWDGQLSALPRETSSAAIFYNQDMFDRSGVAYPGDHWTYDDMLTIARRLTRDTAGTGAIDQWGLHAPIAWYLRANIISAFGGRVLTPEANTFALHEPAGATAVQWIADLIHTHGVATTNADFSHASGRSAMEMVNFWHIPPNQDNAFNWDAAMLPAGPNGIQVRTATGGIGILSGTQYPEEAWQVLKHLSSRESQIKFSGATVIPARRSAAMTPEFLAGVPANRAAFIEGMQYGFVDNVPLAVNDAMDAALSSVWSGSKPATAALEEVRPVIDALLK